MSEGEAYSQLPILYRDERVVVVDKPPGMLVHPNPHDPSCPTCTAALTRSLGCRIFTVHRIDRGTSGLLVFGLDSAGARYLTEQFRDREAKKAYLALARGHLEDSVTVDKPLRNGSTEISSAALSHVRPISRATLAEPVSIYPEAWYTFLEVRLETGRNHQARRHLRHLNHPVIGDMRHGDRDQNRFFASRFGIRHMFLRAYRLQLHHPDGDRPMEFVAGLPRWWVKGLKAIGIDLTSEFPTIPRVPLSEPGGAV